jgi:Ca-activated chloride channel family protein
MSFGAPGYLAFLVAAALAGVAMIWWAMWRGSARGRFGGAAPSERSAYIPPALLLAAAVVAAFASARPQAGESKVTVEHRGIDLMIVLDVSNSMFADDVAPTRLGRAQSEIGALLDRMTGDRAGLVTFAGAPFARSPLTSDMTALRGIVEGVDEERGLVPPGSDLGAAIERAREALLTSTANTKALLIVSDGEDHGGGIASAIAAVRAAGIHVYTGGVGTTTGSALIDVDPQTGDIRPRVDASGAPVVTRLDAAALAGMAADGDGRYVELSGEGRPLAGLAAEFSSLASTAFAAEKTATPLERFQIVAAIALALATGATLASSVRRPAMRTAMRLWPLAGAGMFIAGLCAANAADVNRRGNRHYDAGEYGESLVAYRTAQALDASKGEVYHNAGNALDRGGEYASAIDETKRALPADDDSLEAIVEYALGNHYFGAQRFSDALEAYKRALLANPGDDDAKHNYELTSRRLTPTATPRAPTPPPELPSTPGDGDPGEGEGTPSPPGTPQSGGTPQPGDPGDIPPEQLERLLAEALAGIDEDFTAEEAIRVLELLEERNRDQLGGSAPGGSGQPDY